MTRAHNERVFAVDRLELACAPHRWRFAEEKRTEIEAHFARCRQEKPQLWNGRVLLMRDHTLSNRTLHGTFFETEFANIMAWRDWGFPDRTVTNCFAQGAVRASDGGFLLGVMASHTANAGRIYFPSGTPDPTDIRCGRVDLEASVMRELTEETGLTPDAVSAEPGWHVLPVGARLAVIKLLDARESAEALRARILDHIGSDAHPELSDIHIVHAPCDFDPMMPDFVTAFLTHVWRSQAT